MAGSGWKDYLTFSRKERAGVIVLLGLIAIIYVIPRFLPDSHSVKIYYGDSLKQLSAIKEFQQQNSTGDAHAVDDSVNTWRPGKAIEPTRFIFDPNSLEESGWQRLGVKARTIKTIMNFRSKGGKFRQPEDLRKIYGLRKEDCDQLIPFVRIPVGAAASFGYSQQTTKNARKDSTYEPSAYKQFATPVKSIDINLADSASWEQLPAIGSKLASRIVLFRERLGGFYNTLQVAETFGISDSAFKVIFPYLFYTEVPLRKININVITTSELAKHPYIKWAIANAIVNYRNQHGLIQDIKDLKSIPALRPDLFEKLLPYLSIE
jgi:DNA uptake protein ComE-like DNA-binding protein